MKLGILGLPRSGKSTLFDLLAESVEGPDFSAPNRPRLRTVKVPDARLERLERDYQPRKYTPASLELLDFPAVAGGGENRAGLADLLAPARELEALVVVVRDFESPGEPAPEPLRDALEIQAEFILADLVVVERRLERLAEKKRKRPLEDDDQKEEALLERIRGRLEAEERVAALELGDEDRKRLSGFGLLSSKPFVLAVNQGSGRPAPLDALESAGAIETIGVRARDELEILELAPEDREAFLDGYGIAELSRERLIRAAYRAARRISFFTAGEKEVRAWTIREGETAVEAARAIHSDIARGFIRAEVVSFEEYVRSGGIKGAREKGLLRLEGKEYVMQDGDIVEFRFSV